MNNFVNRHCLLLIIIVSFFGLSACEKNESKNAAQPTAVGDVSAAGSRVDKSVPVAELFKEKNRLEGGTHSHRHAYHEAKLGAAVKLKSVDPLYVSMPGVHEYPLVLVSPNTTGSLKVDVSADDGFSIVSSQRHFEFELQANGEYSLPLTLSLPAEGRFYVNLQIAMNAEGESTSRAISAIVQVGKPLVKIQKAAAANSADKSEAVISLPAQETISPR